MAPSLAESWSVSKDGLVYEFILRQGLKFHNGGSRGLAFSLVQERGKLGQPVRRATPKLGQDPVASGPPAELVEEVQEREVRLAGAGMLHTLSPGHPGEIVLAQDVSPVLHPALAVHAGPSPAYGWETWLYGTANGVAEIFLQDGWVSGLLILCAIAINSPIAALMAALGSLLAVAAGVFLGAPETAIRAGMYGYNAALTDIALGGFFLLLNWPGFLYAVFGVLVAACGWAAIGTVFKPLGMPVLAFPFVIVTWLLLLGSKGFPVLVAIPPADGGDGRGQSRARSRAESGGRDDSLRGHTGRSVPVPTI